METVEKRLPQATVQKAKLPSATLPVCTVKITNYYKEKKTVEKLLTSDTIEPKRKDGAKHENKMAYKKATGRLKSER